MSSRKRPRLSLFNHDRSDEELDTARFNNDLTLKNRFESIFAKYAQDFTGIGDEVDIMTGEVIVNNGHLESMEAETDPGLDHLAGDFTSTSQSMLRAMTVNLNPDLPGPDDVLLSIETIAEKAALSEDSFAGDSEDNLFGSSRLSSKSASISSNSGREIMLDVEHIEPYNSDSDSLFDAGDEQDDGFREGSIDSLFDLTERLTSEPSPIIQRSSDSIEMLHASAHNYQDDDDIMARFGPQVGKEVLHLIGQRQEAHIEPAWRIPVKLDNQPARWSTPPAVASSPPQESPEARRNKSLWRLPPRKRPNQRRKPSRTERNDSVDPLQEDFQSDAETTSSSPARTRANHSESDAESNPEGTFVQTALIQAATNGDCPYCDVNFGNKSGVMAHWDRLLRQPAKRRKLNDSHDLGTMKTIRSTARIRIRYPRLVVYDFRTMVELHEGAGMSFNEISASKTLRTRKTGLQLQTIYNKHRTPPDWSGERETSKQWTQAEENTLLEMCQNPLATMTTLRRGLKGRDELAIGNHLASLWLSQLGIAPGKARQRNDPVVQTIEDSPDVSLNAQAGKHTAPARTERSTIKVEDSEDELFAAV